MSLKCCSRRKKTAISRPAVVGALCLLILPASASLAGEPSPHSSLWGSNGEQWTLRSRLPDFSYAGYYRGEKALPQSKPEMDVRSFGATGDGETDDTAAFQKAINAAQGKVLAVPPGRYKITDLLVIRSSGTQIQGAGPDDSVLVFPVPLNTIRPNWGATTTGRRTSNYSWSGGFLRIEGTSSRRELARVTAAAKRGDRTLAVSSCDPFEAGRDVRLVMTDTPDNTLAVHFYADDSGPIENLRGRSRESFECRLTRVDRQASRIYFDRPLRVDVRLHWQPTLLAADSRVEEVGVEGLGFEFPNGPYRGHFTEVGFNALAMSNVRNCWARNLRIHNCDSGIFLGGANITLQHIVFTSERMVEKSRRATGHHGITLGGQDNLLVDFDIRTRFMHDITMTSGSAGNVVAQGRGIDLALDHHRYGPHANLFTDIDLGLGSRMFQSGGGARLGRHSGAYETFWCVRSQQPQTWPEGWGPDLMNLVGLHSQKATLVDHTGKWFEAISPDRLQPQNLYQAQLAKRLGRE